MLLVVETLTLRRRALNVRELTVPRARGSFGQAQLKTVICLAQPLIKVLIMPTG